MNPAAIAVNRFGLGARADEAAPIDAKKWLLAQFDQYQALTPAWQNQPKTASLIADYSDQLKQMRNADEDAKKSAKRMFLREVKDEYQLAVKARAESALNTKTPFVEHLVHFWANHFAVSIEKTWRGRLCWRI